MASMREAFWVLGHQVEICSGPAGYTYTIVTATPNVPGPPPHSHRDCGEFFQPLDNGLEIFHDSQWLKLDVMQSLYVPSGQVHTFRNVSDQPVRFINIFDPGGFEGFFRDNGHALDGADAQVDSVNESAIQKAIASAERWQMDFHL